MHPMTSPGARGGSLDAYATGYFATSADFADGWTRYGVDPGSSDDRLDAPDLKNFPLVVLWTNEADPVRDQGEAPPA